MSTTIEIESPLGWLALRAQDGRISALSFDRCGEGTEGRSPELEEAVAQLEGYFAGTRRSFSLPLELPRTPFDRAVLTQVSEIPYGERTTYGAVTSSLGLELDQVRKVAAAIGRNPLPIMIPCHRVLGANGSLTGYGGGLDRKARLLALESGQLELAPLAKRTGAAAPRGPRR